MDFNGELQTRVNYVLTKIKVDFRKKVGMLSAGKLEKIEFLKAHDVSSFEEISIHKGHNLVPSILRNSFATLISGTTVTPTFKAKYIALGLNATPANNSDTILVSEDRRFEFDNRYAIENVAYLDSFLGVSQVGTNTYLEIGVFVDGTSSLNTGYLLSRKIINETFIGVEELSINISFTIT